MVFPTTFVLHTLNYCKIKCFFSVFGLNGFKLAVSRCRENNEQNAHVCRI